MFEFNLYLRLIKNTSESTWALGEKIFKFKDFVPLMGLFEWFTETFKRRKMFL